MMTAVEDISPDKRLGQQSVLAALLIELA